MTTNVRRTVRFVVNLCIGFSIFGWLAAGQTHAIEPPIKVDPNGTLGTKGPSGPTADSFDEARRIGLSRSKLRTQKPSGETAPRPEPQLATFHETIAPILEDACIDCHSADTQEGNFRVDTLDPNLLSGGDVDWWLEVMAVLTNGEMPPPDEVELSDDNRNRVIDWLSQEVQTASTLRRSDGKHSSFRRLTKYEYNYALQDLLGLPWEFAKDLPPEASSEDGFQNSSELLHMSVSQFETYHRLARKALERATISGERPPVLHWGISMKQASRHDWPKQASQLEKARKDFADDPDGLKKELEKLEASFRNVPNNTYYKDRSNDRAVSASWSYPRAKYAFAPSDEPPTPPTDDPMVAIIPAGQRRGLTVELGNKIPDEGTLRVRVLASRADAATTPNLQLAFGWQASNEGRAVIPVGPDDVLITAKPDAPEYYQWDIPLGDIYPRNSVRKTSTMGALPSPSEYLRLINTSARKADIQIHYVEVSTPIYDEWPPESHRNIFIESDLPKDSLDYARLVLERFMRRAWRRDISAEEIERKIKLFELMGPECDSFEQTVIEVLATVLSSPDFLYIARVAAAPTDGDSPVPNRLTTHELATRLSFFLWSSVPDDRLLQLADDGTLGDRAVLAKEVRRMLDDPRAERFSERFVHQWLDMQLLEFLKIDERGFDPLLKEAMQREPIELFREVLSSNASLLDFLHADYAIVNERLAKHYGIPNVQGNAFRRVAIEPHHRRGGLLPQAGLLTMNSDGQDSHPLKRGIWLLESLLNDPPPPPPPAVPEIDLADPEIAKLTLKERIEDHRNHAACMSCHSKIDPWGIAFENYDQLGRWRDKIKGKDVDASSRLFNNDELAGMDGLKRYLLENRQDQFVRSLSHKLTTYALGRPLGFADHSSVDAIAAAARKDGDGLATLIEHIVLSDLFQTR